VPKVRPGTVEPWRAVRGGLEIGKKDSLRKRGGSQSEESRRIHSTLRQCSGQGKLRTGLRGFSIASLSLVLQLKNNLDRICGNQVTNNDNAVENWKLR